MSMRTVLIVVLALAFAGLAAAGVNAALRNQGPATQAVETVQVVTPKVDIGRGQVITAPMVQTRAFPKEFLLPNTIIKVEDVIDRTVVNPVLKDEPIVENRLGVKGARALEAI